MIWLVLALTNPRQTESRHNDPVPIQFSRLLKPGWQLVSRAISYGDVLGGDRLYLRRTDAPDRLMPVKSMGDLRGRVHLVSNEDALTFVRMRTYAEFGSKFIPLTDWMEISHGPGPQEGWFGGITDARWRRAKLHEPRVQRLSRGWVVRRDVVDFTRLDALPSEVSETVRADGRYSLTSKRRLHRRALRGVFWHSEIVAE